VLDGAGVVLDGDVLDGDVLGEPVLDPADDPSDVGADPVVPLLVEPVVPFRLVFEPLVSPVLVPLVLEPMLPGCEPLWLPVCEPIEPLEEPVLPAAPVPAPLPDVWANANVASESVATIKSLRIL
jgi:hypothetical protein